MADGNALTGGRVNYYLAWVAHPQREEQSPYQAECEDIIHALGMTFDEACEFKAIWRTAAARKSTGKPGHSAIYDAEKRLHYAGRSLKHERQAAKDREREEAVVQVKDLVQVGLEQKIRKPMNQGEALSQAFRADRTAHSQD